MLVHGIADRAPAETLIPGTVADSAYLRDQRQLGVWRCGVRQRERPAARAFPLVIGSLRFDLTVEGSHRPGVPMSVRLCGHLWAGDGRAAAGRMPFASPALGRVAPEQAAAGRSHTLTARVQRSVPARRATPPLCGGVGPA
jgi:hypothetical protein